MAKIITIEPSWKIHSYYKRMIADPPIGYKFIGPDNRSETLVKTASKIRYTYPIFFLANELIPLNLAKSFFAGYSKIGKNVDLTYSCDHVIFRREPWVVDLEYVSLLAGYDVRQFSRYKKIINRLLESDCCKKIICGTVAASNTVLNNLDVSKIKNKLAIVPFASTKREFIKLRNDSIVKFLFVGSANIPGEFEMKGGRETLEAFRLISRKFQNVELVVRSDVPQDVKRSLAGVENVRLIEETLPWEKLEREFLSADVFILPVHNTPYSALLDAMSYELPIITIDAWANKEIVDDGKTGFVVNASEKIPYYVQNHMPAFGTSRFKVAIKSPDKDVVERLVTKASALIEQPELRRRMGSVGRWEVEYGRFSSMKRKDKLKKIFDEALGDCRTR